MGFSRQDVLRLTAEIEGHIGSAKWRLAELKRAILAIDLPEPPEPYACPICSLPFRTEEKRTDHLANVHGEEVTREMWPNRWPLREDANDQ